MKLKFNVTGMTCAACSARVEKVTNAVPGVEKAEVNLLAGTMQVEAENGNVVPAIIKAVQDAGYNAALPGEKKTDKAEAAPAEAALKEMKKRIIGSAICLVVLMYFTMGHMIGLPAPHWYHGVKNALVAALPLLDRKLHGFADAGAVMTGVETRSSSPVRILRGADLQAFFGPAPADRDAPGASGLYPCGEGAGYAGGIMSAACDGLRVAEAIVADAVARHGLY